MQEEIQIKVHQIDFILKNPDILHELRKLTLNQTSGMNFELSNFIKISKFRKVNARVILAFYNEKIIGWALLSKERSNFIFPHSMGNFEETDGYLFEVFVNPLFRKKGIAKRLLLKAKLLVRNSTLCVCPHDYKSRLFYNKYLSINGYKAI